MYACMHAFMHVCMFVCMYVCMHACMHVCSYILLHYIAAQALCSAKHQLMSRGANKPTGETVATADGTPNSSTDPEVTIRCTE